MNGNYINASSAEYDRHIASVEAQMEEDRCPIDHDDLTISDLYFDSENKMRCLICREIIN